MGGGGVPKNPPQNMYPGAFPIAGRMVSERERLVGMTDAERAWRAQWLKDQHLAPNEPRFVPELQKEGVNVIRRMYRWPLDTIFKALMPVLVNFFNSLFINNSPLIIAPKLFKFLQGFIFISPSFLRFTDILFFIYLFIEH